MSTKSRENQIQLDVEVLSVLPRSRKEISTLLGKARTWRKAHLKIICNFLKSTFLSAVRESKRQSLEDIQSRNHCNIIEIDRSTRRVKFEGQEKRKEERGFVFTYGTRPIELHPTIPNPKISTVPQNVRQRFQTLHAS